MQEEVDRSGDAAGKREQRPGEGGTTRFGMEEGDNIETPATGGPAADEEGEQSGS